MRRAVENDVIIAIKAIRQIIKTFIQRFGDLIGIIGFYLVNILFFFTYRNLIETAFCQTLINRTFHFITDSPIKNNAAKISLCNVILSLLLFPFRYFTDLPAFTLYFLLKIFSNISKVFFPAAPIDFTSDKTSSALPVSHHLKSITKLHGANFSSFSKIN